MPWTVSLFRRDGKWGTGGRVFEGENTGRCPVAPPHGPLGGFASWTSIALPLHAPHDGSPLETIHWGHLDGNPALPSFSAA